MALVRKLSGSATASKETEPKAKPVRAKLQLSLETELSTPPASLTDYSWLIYGRKKIGKTTLAAQFPGAYFLSTEPGTKALRVLGSACPTWEHFTGYIDLLCKEANPERTVIVDVIDFAYDMIYRKVCDQQMVESPTDMNDFGATWKKIRRLFREQLMRLVTRPGGVVFLSHDTEKEVELRDGSKVERVQPTMSSQAMGEVEGLVDVIGLYEYHDEGRILRIDGTTRMLAGCRLNEHFKYTDGSRMSDVPMGANETEAWENLNAAFRNEFDAPPPPQKKELRKVPSAKPSLSLKK